MKDVGGDKTLAERLFELDTDENVRNRGQKRDRIMLEPLNRSRQLLLDNEKWIQRTEIATLVNEAIKQAEDRNTLPRKVTTLLKKAEAAAGADGRKFKDGITIDIIRLYEEGKLSYILPLKRAKKGSVEHTLFQWMESSSGAQEIGDFHGYMVLSNVPWEPDPKSPVNLNILETDLKYEPFDLKRLAVLKYAESLPRPDAAVATGIADVAVEGETEEAADGTTGAAVAGKIKGIPYDKWVTVEDIVKSEYGLKKVDVYRNINTHGRALQVKRERAGIGHRKVVFITEQNAHLCYRIPGTLEETVEQPANAGAADNGDGIRRRASPLADAMYAEIERRGRMMTCKELARCPRIKRVSKSRTLANTVYTTADSNRDRFVRERAGYNIKPRK